MIELTNASSHASELGPPAFGGLAWAEARGGALDAGDWRRMVSESASLQLRVWLQDLLRALCCLSVKPAFDVEKIVQPSSDVAQAAEELCRRVSGAALVEHCFRAFFWGSILGHQDGLRYDAELFYVACLLHDVGLTQHAASSQSTPCFAVAGGRAAEDFLRAAGWSATRRRSVGDAISMHLNPFVPASRPEAYLLQAGTGVDVIGLRYAEIDPTTVAAVIARHPRLGFKRAFAAAWRAEARHRPSTRVHCASRWLGFERRIRVSPFAE